MDIDIVRYKSFQAILIVSLKLDFYLSSTKHQKQVYDTVVLYKTTGESLLLFEYLVIIKLIVL